ncbi:MAG: response regulator transcription factor [Rubrobacteraceae bacterium]
MESREEPVAIGSITVEDDPIRIAIADDHQVFSRSLATILDSQPDMEVVGEASTGEEIISLCLEQEPDVVLMDVTMPVMDGIVATREIRNLLPSTQILILTVHADDEHVFRGIKAGAHGYLLKDSFSKDLIRAVRGVHAGEAVLSPDIAWRVLSVFEGSGRHKAELMPSLTDNEVEVVRLMIEGRSTGDIARELSITETAMHNYVSGIYEKLHVYDRSQVVVKAVRQGLADGKSS